MEHYIVTLDERGILYVSDVSTTVIWVNEPELMKLFDVVILMLRTAIKAVYKNDILSPGKVERRAR